MNTLAIPSQIVALLTFPGVVLHEVVVQLLCRRLRIAMGHVCYIRFGSPAGYVIHEPPADLCQAFVLGLGPFFVNSILGAVIAFPAIFPALEFRVSTTGDYALAWLGVSIAMHAFPSADETGELWRAVWSPRGSILTRLFATPLVAFMYGGALGRLICLDLLYGIGVVVLGPALLVYTLP